MNQQEQETLIELTDEHWDMIAGGYGGAEGDPTVIRHGKNGEDLWLP